MKTIDLMSFCSDFKARGDFESYEVVAENDNGILCISNDKKPFYFTLEKIDLNTCLNPLGFFDRKGVNYVCTVNNFVSDKIVTVESMIKFTIGGEEEVEKELKQEQILLF